VLYHGVDRPMGGLGSATLRGDILVAVTVFGTLRGCEAVEVVPKMVASWWRAVRRSSPSLANGAAGEGCRSA
jgi:hypothetical protein